MISEPALIAQEERFARAFAAGDLSLVRALYHPDVVYVSPTVRLFGWPARIEGVERTLEFIGLTIRHLESIAYRAVEWAMTGRRRSCASTSTSRARGAGCARTTWSRIATATA